MEWARYEEDIAAWGAPTLPLLPKGVALAEQSLDTMLRISYAYNHVK